MCNRGRQSAKDFVVGIDYEPVSLDFVGIRGKRFHKSKWNKGKKRSADDTGQTKSIQGFLVNLSTIYENFALFSDILASAIEISDNSGHI